MTARTPPNRARVKTIAEVQEWFRRTGTPVTEWARTRGFSPDAVYAVLYERTKGRRGQSHQIAVQLGLKQGVATTTVRTPVRGRA